MAGQTTAQAFPLSWPTGVKRTEPGRRRNAAFTEKTVKVCVDKLRNNVKLLPAQGVAISTNIPLKVDGDPYSNPGRLPDPGVALYFTMKGTAYCLPCDRWSTVEDNLWAIALHLEAMRGMERWGVGSVEQQFMGYKALSSTAGEGEDPWMVLGLAPMSPEASVLAAHRKLAIEAHPDRGGNSDQMSRVNVARDMALAALKVAL